MNEPRPEVIKLLLAHKADPNSKGMDGQPLIFSAVKNAEVMKAFLDAGANPNVDDDTPHLRTPLLMANDPKITTMLLAAGAKTETRHRGICDASDLGMTPLLIRVSCWTNIAVAEALLKGGAEVNARTVTGSAALHYAAANKNKELMELLIAHKADVNARDNQGLTPLDYAEGKQQPTGAPGLPTVGSIPTPGRPIRGTGQAEVNSETVAELLRQHGGLGDLPKLDRIEVTRPETGYREAVFVSGTNQWNQFTLMELLAKQWGLLSLQRKGTWSGGHAERAVLWNGSPLRFPALDRITIHRTSQSGARREKIAVNFDEAISKQGRAGDVPLEYGDVVEIPEEDHPVTEQWLGLPDKSLAVMTNRLTRSVSLKVGGLSTNLSLHPSLDPSPTLGVLKLTASSFMIRSVLDESKLIRSSSDLTRVKVTRRESANAKPRVWVLDCSVPDKAPDLWLRDGDVIEVPEK